MTAHERDGCELNLRKRGARVAFEGHRATAAGCLGQTEGRAASGVDGRAVMKGRARVLKAGACIVIIQRLTTEGGFRHA